MPALVDLFEEQMKLPPRERIVAVAMWFSNHPYQSGGKSAGPLDGVAGSKVNPTDCSGLICSVFNAAFPPARLNAALTGTSKLFTSEHFENVKSPQNGDIALWSGHGGIVVNATAGKMLHAPGEKKPVRLVEWKYIDMGAPTFRRWKHLA